MSTVCTYCQSDTSSHPEINGSHTNLGPALRGHFGSTGWVSELCCRWGLHKVDYKPSNIHSCPGERSLETDRDAAISSPNTQRYAEKMSVLQLAPFSPSQREREAMEMERVFIWLYQTALFSMTLCHSCHSKCHMCLCWTQADRLPQWQENLHMHGAVMINVMEGWWIFIYTK